MDLATTAGNPGLVLTLSCQDTTGIVAAVSGFLAARHYCIGEAQHYNDPSTVTSFMRTVFHATPQARLPQAQIEREFKAEVADLTLLVITYRYCRKIKWTIFSSLKSTLPI